MITLPQELMTGSALLLFALGALHLVYTFIGNRLYPRDTHLERQMRIVAPVLTRHTTMWKAWVGFNASHSYGAMFFGLVYGYLAWTQADLLFHSWYLLAVGLLLLGGYLFLGVVYWFWIPLTGIVLSTALYGCAVVAYWAR